MKTRVVLSSILVLALSGCSHHSVYGTFRECSLACEEITLRPDSTFTYRLWGDLFGDSSVSGTWSFVDKHRHLISAETSNQGPRAASVREIPALDDGVTIRVLDPSGEPIPGARVLAYCTGDIHGKNTDATGSARLPLCAVTHLEVEFPDFQGLAQDVGPSRAYEVTLPAIGREATMKLGLFYVSHGVLYRLEGEPLPRMTSMPNDPSRRRPAQPK